MAKQLLPAGLLVLLAAGVWYLWSNQGRTHQLTLDARAFGQTYDPYSWWGHYRRQDFIRHYPQRVGEACLNTPLEAQEGSYATRPGAAPYA